MPIFPCPYLNSVVEFTEEREQHVAGRHPELLPEHENLIAQVLMDPDEVRRSARHPSARLFSRWYTELRDGKHVVVIVERDTEPVARNWVLTAYMARKLIEGESEWTRD